MTGYRFVKNERLKSSKTIGQLFKSGSSFGMYPLRAVWKLVEQNPEKSMLQIAVSVPKKKFPRAVDRNRLRRQVREAFRLHKHRFEQIVSDAPPIALMILYTGVEALPYSTIETAMIRMLKRLAGTLNDIEKTKQESVD